MEVALAGLAHRANATGLRLLKLAGLAGDGQRYRGASLLPAYSDFVANIAGRLVLNLDSAGSVISVVIFEVALFYM